MILKQSFLHSRCSLHKALDCIPNSEAVYFKCRVSTPLSNLNVECPHSFVHSHSAPVNETSSTKRYSHLQGYSKRKLSVMLRMSADFRFFFRHRSSEPKKMKLNCPSNLMQLQYVFMYCVQMFEIYSSQLQYVRFHGVDYKNKPVHEVGSEMQLSCQTRVYLLITGKVEVAELINMVFQSLQISKEK